MSTSVDQERPASTRQLRPYQTTAIADTLAHLQRDDTRGWAHMACGSGKTLVALRIAEGLASDECVVVIAAPTIALIAQLLADWRADAEHRFAALSVCSDDTAVDVPVHRADRTIDTTTCPGDVESWLRGTRGRRYIFTTYASAHIVATALKAVHRRADLFVCDEAHHLTGPAEALSRRVVAQHDFMPARRCFYMTATPKIDLRMTAASDHIGMDNESVFGHRTVYYPFHQAIADGYLKDYRITVIGVTEAEVRALLTDTSVEYTDGVGASTLRTLATQVALAKAQMMYGIRRVISFHFRVSDAADFTRTLPSTLARLPPHQCPQGQLYVGHVHGEQNMHQRNWHLDRLRNPPEAGWTVLGNARCLGEGIDVPAVDAIVFGHAKRSTVDIVQAVGRALRRDQTRAGDNKATIIVPIVVPHNDGTVAELDAGNYQQLWNVIRALRAHDEELGTALDKSRANHDGSHPPSLPDKITVVLPPGAADHVLQQLRVMTVRETTSTWWEGYGAAARFRSEYGHVLPAEPWRDPGTGIDVQAWLRSQRYRARNGDLALQRRAMLDQLDMVWDVATARWAKPLAAATEFHAEFGHLRVPEEHVSRNGFPLGQRAARWRYRLTDGTLPSAVATALEDLGLERPGIRELTRAQLWKEGLKHAEQFYRQHGHLEVADRERSQDGYELGIWVRRQRAARKTNRLRDNEIADLDSLGMRWERDRSHEAWIAGLAAAAAYRADKGNLQVPARHVTSEGFALGAWLKERRREYAERRLAQDRVAALEGLGMVWHINDARWEVSYAAARKFYKTHGNLDIGYDYCDPETGARLGYWIYHQRELRRGVKSGKLTADRIRRLDAIGMIWGTVRSVNSRKHGGVALG